MTENKKKKTRGVSINNAGKVNQLLITWLKGWELEKLEDIERRLSALEEERRG